MNTTAQSKKDSLSRKDDSEQNCVVNQQILIHANSAEYSIIFGCTPDVCHIEQATMILQSKPQVMKYVVMTLSAREHFCGFVPLQEATRTFYSGTSFWKI